MSDIRTIQLLKPPDIHAGKPVPEKENDSLASAVVEETAVEIWSGRAESNRRLILGKDPFYH